MHRVPIYMCPPGVLGILGEWPFIFRELGSTGNYLRGGREQAHNFGDLGSLVKRQKKGKASISFYFFKNFFCFWGASPQDPQLYILNDLFRANMLIKIDLREKFGNSVFLWICFKKRLIFRLVITYFGTPQIAPDLTIFVKIFRGSKPPNPLATV